MSAPLSAQARHQRTSLIVVFAIVFVDLVGFGIVIPVLPLYAERFGASPLTVGLLVSIYSAMQFICAPILGKLSDRLGRRPILLVSIIGTSLGFLLMGLAHTLTLLFVARIIDGITGGNISTALAYIADITPPEHRSKRMGLVGAAFGLGLVFGPAIGGLMSHVSLAAPFLFASGMAALNALAVYYFLPESLAAKRRHEAEHHASIAEVFQAVKGPSLPLILTTYFFVTAAFSLLTATYSLFTERRFGLGAIQNGYLFAGQGLIGAIIQGGLLGWLVRHSSDKKLAIAGTAVLSVSLFVLPTSPTMALLLLATAGVAVGHGLVAAPLNGLASKSASGSAQGRVMGLMQSAGSLARIVGPVVGGWLLNHDAVMMTESFGRTPYWLAGVFMAVACVLASNL